MTATATAEYLCVNGYGKQAIPISVAHVVVRKWCEQHPQYEVTPDSGHKSQRNQMSPQNTLASLSGIHERLMYDVFNNKNRSSSKPTATNRRKKACVTTTISLDVMDRILVGMDCTELWYAPPLDLYYLPIDEWTDEMRGRHESC